MGNQYFIIIVLTKYRVTRCRLVIECELAQWYQASAQTSWRWPSEKNRLGVQAPLHV